ncbi:zinc-dependent alcohol dehydrogenase [Limnochorda pilosa]|uniref:Alcohol dehydrogenase n=1 Tax=Limnochorda pilosa TaxID=1555112 RepID=A0A0K2SLN8_LIMPI|nr:alcohol dehydrogenase catalytic domain-containing protein [Limnochorda pilosa]BAS28041.1 alcohol dehydrogenase [Limnochorda pilosa]
MRAALFREIGSIVVEDRPVPEPGPGEVRIKPLAVGICGSDMHAFAGEHPFVHPPIVLGHEIGAQVDEVGPGVEELRPGQLVTVEPNLVCGTCHNCRTGRYNICENLRVIGCVGYDGAMTEYMVVPSEKVFPVPAHWSAERAALVEPVAVGVHAIRQGGFQPGQNVLVLGAGIIGLVTAQAARAFGAGRIIVVDLLGSRLERARGLGFTDVVNNATADLQQELRRLLKGELPDMIFDCVAIQPTLDTAVEIARKGTRIVVVGVPAGRLSVPMHLVQDRELELVGTLMYRREDYDASIRLMESGAISTEGFITHRFAMDQVMEAFSVAINQKETALKVMLTVGA